MVHSAAFLAALSICTTALTVEAMVGRAGSFHPFIHEVARPHPGQAEVARAISDLVRSVPSFEIGMACADTSICLAHRLESCL